MNLENRDNFFDCEYDYQFEKMKDNQVPKKDISKWDSKFGTNVIKRDKNGFAKSVEFSLLINNSNIDIFIVGDFNYWGNVNNIEEYKLEKDKYSIFAKIVLENKIKHKDRYKFLIKENKKEFLIQDPAGVYFDDEGNSIFWDFYDPTSYKQKYIYVNNFERSIKILQTDLPGLIKHFADKKGILGSNISSKQYYKFISECGVIDEIKRLGFNTIQFLPFAQSIDGDNWKFRYLVPFQFAIQKNWGNPDEFAQMIDMFHKAQIGVIGDFVLGHVPHKDFQIFGQSFLNHGIHHWKKTDNTNLYIKDETFWGTCRIDFDNKYVREFFISSCLHFMKYYKIDGFRIDNVDGIIRYGNSGQGDERPNGRVFLRELNQSIYDYNPSAIIHFEAHYFAGDNAKMLVAPFENNKRALGSTAYNSSRLTYYFHTDYMIKSAEKIQTWKFKHITEEKEWGKSNSTVADFHNHDAAAGLMEMRCTGSYAYDSMLAISSSNHIHAVGKIKVMEAIIAFCTEGRILDLMQTFLLQTGSFEHDTSIQWYLTYNEVNHNVVEFKKKINEILDDPAFWPIYTKNREFLNIDDKNKIIVVERRAIHNQKKTNYICVINLSDWKHYNYKVGVKISNNYELVLNSDKFEYAGFGIATYPKIFENKESKNFELLDREIELPIIAPYGIIVLKMCENE